MKTGFLGVLGLAVSLTAYACTAEETATTAATSAGTGGGGGAASVGGAGGGGGEAPTPASFCESEGLAVRPFDEAGPFGSLRHDKAEDFTLPLFDGTSLTLSEIYSGCESYVFLTNARSNSALDKTSLWERDVDALIAKSPKNAHYFFVAARVAADASAELTAMQGRIDAALAALEPTLAAHWKARLHVVGKHYTELDGWLRDILTSTDLGRGGFAVDRRQEVRLMGHFADVTRYKKALNDAGEWPWESNLAYATHEVRRYNYEAARDAKLAEEDATVVTAFTKGEVLKYVVESEVVFPTAEQLAKFDTLEVDLTMDCPDAAKGEFGNCGAWDYISNIDLWEEDTQSWRELARFITTYHREGRYIVDITPMLAFLKDGGVRKLRYVVSPEWNQQAYATVMDFRFSNRNKGYRPTGAVFLYSGGGFNKGYNMAHAPMDVDVPATAKHVELWGVLTGHGMDSFNCAEFCRHQHHFTVNAKTYLKDHATVGQDEGCIDQIENGMVPNQGGTWWFGRGGWCPGQQVDPFVFDVTADVKAGETANLSYKATLNNKEPPDNAGNIVLNSYLVFYE